MAFAPPLRSELGTTVSRALRDPNGSVFPAETINDFIGQAMADLSAYRPKEMREVAAWPLPDPSPFVDLTAVWKVEVRILNNVNDYVRTLTIPYGDPSGGSNRAGWDFYAGELLIPPFWTTRIDAATVNQVSEMWVYGYADRDIPTDDFEVLDLQDTTDYDCVLNHCKSLGFELLNHDRALYQQWIAATNNTDVSPTQLSGMLNQAESTFQRSRSRNTKLRRVPVGDALTAR